VFTDLNAGNSGVKEMLAEFLPKRARRLFS
jgi:hypothetical protein